MSNSTYSRRQVLTGSVTAGLGLVVLGAAACKSEPPPLACTDVSALTPEEAKVCTGCAQYKPGAPNTCGACILVKGPINPKGGCSVWAAKPPA